MRVDAGQGRTRLHIGGMYPTTFNHLFYSEQGYHALHLAISHVNNNAHILPYHELVLLLNDSKCDVGLTLYQMNQLLTSSKANMIALVGEACSPVTQPLSATTQLWNVPLFNFVSQSEKLENRIIYQRYYHVLPTATGLNRARVLLLSTLNWKKSVVVIESAELFTLTAKDFRERAVKVGLDLPSLHVLPANNNFTDTAQQVKKENVHVLIGLFYEDTARQVICTFYKNGVSAPNFVWIFVGFYESDWYLLSETTNCTQEEMKQAVNGHFIIDFIQISENIDKQTWIGKNITEIVREFQMIMNMSSSTPVDETFTKYSAYGYDLILAMARVIDIAVHELNATGRLDQISNFTYDDDHVANLFDSILTNRSYLSNGRGQESFSVEGLTGTVKFFNLLSPDEKEETGVVKIKYIRTLVDESDQVTNVAFFNNRDVNATKIEGVEKIPWTTSDGIAPRDSSNIVLELGDKGVFIAVAVVDCICILMAFGLLIYINLHRDHSVIKKSFPYLSRLIVSGGIVIYAVVLLYGFDGIFFKFNRSSLASCYLRTILLAVGFTAVFGSVLVKTITNLTKRVLGSKMQEESLLLLIGILIFGCLLLIDCILLSLWAGVNPWQEKEEIRSSTVLQTYIRHRCASDNSTFWISGLIVYKVVVVLICITAVTIRAKVKTTQQHGTSDSPYVDLSAIFSCIILIVPAFGFTFIELPNVRYSLVSVTLMFTVSAVLLIYFYRKIQWIRQGIEENRDNPRADYHDADNGGNVDLEVQQDTSRELQGMRRRSRDLRLTLEKVIKYTHGLDDSLVQEANSILRNEATFDSEDESVLVNQSSTTAEGSLS
ncbi:gamma-aminobutyric acid type B receptor subunit 2-like [Corticium candelabrum]|uniref:gamma-aminobutyric acid type B receptor subunit 2-like n=1 Tax=Corticium candelabrum TaxID=121492 RepID=UPI002E261D3C|nr:gamma-aminobutyric acid type B receptor subunit 2-like [Corticium candelabrum]